jgi:hypothetical protein
MSIRERWRKRYYARSGKRVYLMGSI